MLLTSALRPQNWTALLASFRRMVGVARLMSQLVPSVVLSLMTRPSLSQATSGNWGHTD